MLDPRQALHSLMRRSCSHFCDPPQSLHRLFSRLWGRCSTPGALHLLLSGSCSHICDPPHSMHWLFSRLWGQMLASLALAPAPVMLTYLRSPAILTLALLALVGACNRADARPQTRLAPAPPAVMLADLRSPAFHALVPAAVMLALAGRHCFSNRDVLVCFLLPRLHGLTCLFAFSCLACTALTRLVFLAWLPLQTPLDQAAAQ